MTTTYDSALSANKDRVRFLVGDTASPWDLQDEEITYALTLNVTVGAAALFVARALYARYSKQVSRSVGDLSIQFGQKADHWASVIATLQDQADRYDPPQVWAGGQDPDEETADEGDESLTQPGFKRGQFDIIGGERVTNLLSDQD